MDKAPDAFRTISEVAEDLQVPQHVLRFWESRFSQIKPLKRGGGRRYYRPDDVNLLRGIRHLLYGEGYTIRGVQRILREHGPRFVQGAWQEGAMEVLRAARHEPEAIAPADAPQPGASPSVEPAAPRAHDGGRSLSVAEGSVPLDQSDRSKLRTALDQLTACRRLIDAAYGKV